MSNNRHDKNKKSKRNHPKPKTLIDGGSTYSPNSIGGRIDLQALKDKLFCREINEINETNHAKDSQTSLQGKGEKK